MKRLRVSLIALTIWFLLFGYASAQDQPIKLGVQFIMSGKLEPYGKNGERAILIAIDEINAAGGILGRKVEALFADTQLKSDVAVKNAGKFVLEDKLDFMVGPTSSAVATALIDLAGKYKDPGIDTGGLRRNDGLKIQSLCVQHLEQRDDAFSCRRLRDGHNAGHH